MFNDSEGICNSAYECNLSHLDPVITLHRLRFYTAVLNIYKHLSASSSSSSNSIYPVMLIIGVLCWAIELKCWKLFPE